VGRTGPHGVSSCCPRLCPCPCSGNRRRYTQAFRIRIVCLRDATLELHRIRTADGRCPGKQLYCRQCLRPGTLRRARELQGKRSGSQTTDENPKEHTSEEGPLCECILPPRVPARGAAECAAECILPPRVPTCAAGVFVQWKWNNLTSPPMQAHEPSGLTWFCTVRCAYSCKRRMLRCAYSCNRCCTVDL
jgi:hypothetical protein